MSASIERLEAFAASIVAAAGVDADKAGRDGFARLMDHFSQRCRDNPPIDPARPVRLPGDSAARSIAQSERDGIDYDEPTRAALARCAHELGVASPLETPR